MPFSCLTLLPVHCSSQKNPVAHVKKSFERVCIEINPCFTADIYQERTSSSKPGLAKLHSDFRALGCGRLGDADLAIFGKLTSFLISVRKILSGDRARTGSDKDQAQCSFTVERLRVRQG